MFVVVYLVGPKKLTVVPEEFIFDLNQRKLKNFGCNSNQVHRIYFSKEWYQNQTDGVNLQEKFEPNFNLRPRNVYPLPDNETEAVFLGYLRKFEGMYHELLFNFIS